MDLNVANCIKICINQLIDFIKSLVSEVTKKYVNLPMDFLRAQDVHLPKFQIIFSFFVSVIEKRQEISTFFTYHS